MSNSPVVYIVNKSSHDFSDAKRFGQLVYITEGNVNPFNVNKMVRQIKESFATARPHDYILVTSLTVLCCAACAVFAEKFGRLNLLLFKDGKYIERKITLKDD